MRLYRSLAMATLLVCACKGAEGPAGPTGATGPQGPQGPTGAQGQSGPQGPAGPQGLPGVAGLPGPTGATGATGATGPAGPQGPQGVPGTPGTSGSPSLTRLNYVVPLSTTGSASQALPAAAGTATNPPLIACYTAEATLPTIWLAVNDGWSTNSTYCGLVFNNGVWNVVMSRGLSGWLAAFIVVY